VDDDRFANAAPAVSGRVEFDRNLSLAAGRDQPRGGGRRAASTGLDFFDSQVGAALVLDEEIVLDRLPF
jgi:hypothetical protein